MRNAVRLAFALVLASCVRSGDPGVAASEGAILYGEPEPARFEELDTNRDRSVDASENLRDALRYHEAWDLDQDGHATEAELAHGLFATLDRDGDRRVTRAELELPAWRLFPSRARDATRWDEDGNGLVDREELREGLRRLEVFAAYDRDGDGSITDLELADALLAFADADRDGSLQAREWRATTQAPALERASR